MLAKRNVSPEEPQPDDQQKSCQLHQCVGEDGSRIGHQIAPQQRQHGQGRADREEARYRTVCGQQGLFALQRGRGGMRGEVELHPDLCQLSQIIVPHPIAQIGVTRKIA